MQRRAETTIRSIGIAALIALLSLAASGQPPPPTRAFEVASIKLHDTQGGRIGIATSGLRLTAEAKSVMGLIMYAYTLKGYQAPYTPALLRFGDIFYDIAAKAEAGPPPSTDEFRRMLQLLLADRFKLKFHREARELPVYALVVGRNGSKLRESPGADSTPRYTPIGRNYEITIKNATMDDLLLAIENSFMDRPVLDRTGLTGAYEIRMTYTPDTPANRKSPDPDDIGIFAAIQKLGLKLEPVKATMDMLVVDHVESPSGN